MVVYDLVKEANKMRFYQLLSDPETVQYYINEYRCGIYGLARELAIDNASDSYEVHYYVSHRDVIMFKKGVEKFSEYCKKMNAVYESLNLPMRVVNSRETFYSQDLYDWLLKEAFRTNYSGSYVYIGQCRDSWKRSMEKGDRTKDRSGELFFFRNMEIPEYITEEN